MFHSQAAAISLKVTELKEILRKFQGRLTGTKSELIQRIVEIAQKSPQHRELIVNKMLDMRRERFVPPMPSQLI